MELLAELFMIIIELLLKLMKQMVRLTPGQLFNKLIRVGVFLLDGGTSLNIQ
jgi:hypothetical protein